MDPNIFESNHGTLAWHKTGAGKPVLILHGWGSDSKVMMPMAKLLQNIRTSYLLDFPGFGKSPDPSSPWSVDNYADIVQDFISKEIKEPTVDLIVHSFGGRVAIKLLTRTEISDRIDKVVFTGAAGLKPKRSASFYIKKYTAKILKMPFYLLPSGLREKGLQNLRQTSLWKKLGSSDYQKLNGVMRETFVKCVTEYLDYLLPKINHEVLLIWGENDTSTPLEQGKRMKKLLKESALIVVDGAGHYAFLNKPKYVASVIKAYLEPAS